jgi:hypothetical protein
MQHLYGAADGRVLKDDRDDEVLVERSEVHRAHPAPTLNDLRHLRVTPHRPLELRQVEAEVRPPGELAGERRHHLLG